MYKIKGLDQQEYGPVDAAQVRQWISQGRADGQTLARLEGTADWRPLNGFPEFAATIAPPLLSSAPHAPSPDNTLASLIPYRNVPALVAYYLGVFSLIPCVGFVLGIGGVISGVMGLMQARKHPEAKGKVHAWIGIVLGALVVAAHVVVFILFIAADSRRR